VERSDELTPFRKLPSIPDFAVYGLGAEYRGHRWVALWNPPEGPVKEVDLGHGDLATSRGPTLVVVTCVNGVDYVGQARGKALLYLMHVQQELASDPSIRSRFDRLQRDAGPEAGWQPTQIIIDGDPHGANLYHHTVGWAAVVDMGAVAIGIFGNGIKLESHELAEVNRTLGDYAATA
jgi:hypothetical protein